MRPVRRSTQEIPSHNSYTSLHSLFSLFSHSCLKNASLYREFWMHGPPMKRNSEYVCVWLWWMDFLIYITLIYLYNACVCIYFILGSEFKYLSPSLTLNKGCDHCETKIYLYIYIFIRKIQCGNHKRRNTVGLRVTGWLVDIFGSIEELHVFCDEYNKW